MEARASFSLGEGTTKEVGIGGLRSGAGGGEKPWLHLICPGGQEVQETL